MGELLSYPSNDNPPSPILPTRKKSEVNWTGLTGITIPADTPINLITFLKGLPAPGSGQFAPFFNTTTNKLNVFNDDVSVPFKLNLVGRWAGGSSNRSMQLDFTGTLGNRLVESRDAAVTEDTITLDTFFSVDKNGNLATNGSPPILRSNGGSYSLFSCSIIAEQTTSVSVINPV